MERCAHVRGMKESGQLGTFVGCERGKKPRGVVNEEGLLRHERLNRETVRAKTVGEQIPNDMVGEVV